MGTHLIPREIDGDARILLIFTPKGFIGTLIGMFVGIIFYSVANLLRATIVGWVLLAICACIGFVIGQVKIPESNAFSLFKKTGGEYVSDIILKYIRFQKTKKIYLYDETDYSTDSKGEDNENNESLPIQKSN